MAWKENAQGASAKAAHWHFIVGLVAVLVIPRAYRWGCGLGLRTSKRSPWPAAGRKRLPRLGA